MPQVFVRPHVELPEQPLFIWPHIVPVRVHGEEVVGEHIDLQTALNITIRMPLGDTMGVSLHSNRAGSSVWSSANLVANVPNQR